MTGWTVAEIGRLPWRTAMELFRYWAEQPPVHVLLAAFLGVRPPAPADQNSAEWRALAAASGAPKPLGAVPAYVLEAMTFDA